MDCGSFTIERDNLINNLNGLHLFLISLIIGNSALLNQKHKLLQFVIFLFWKKIWGSLNVMKKRKK